jgi:hypothetical protein
MEMIAIAAAEMYYDESLFAAVNWSTLATVPVSPFGRSDYGGNLY